MKNQLIRNERIKALGILESLRQELLCDVKERKTPKIFIETMGDLARINKGPFTHYKMADWIISQFTEKMLPGELIIEIKEIKRYEDL